MPSRSRRSSSARIGSSPHDPAQRGRAAGFTLLEVLVALAILGIGLGVIFPGIAMTLRLRREAADSARLSIVAEQVLGDLATRKKAPESPEEGDVGGCHWLLEPVGAPAPAAGAAGEPHGAELVQARLTVSTQGGPSWELLTLLPRGKPEAKP
ncbi:MAG TPA: type II secretion system protein [bacterium]